MLQSGKNWCADLLQSFGLRLGTARQGGPRQQRVSTHAQEGPSPSALNSGNVALWRAAVPPAASRAFGQLPSPISWRFTDPWSSPCFAAGFFTISAAGCAAIECSSRGPNCSPPSGNCRVRLVEPCHWPWLAPDPGPSELAAGLPQTSSSRTAAGDDAMTLARTCQGFGLTQRPLLAASDARQGRAPPHGRGLGSRSAHQRGSRSVWRDNEPLFHPLPRLALKLWAAVVSPQSPAHLP